MKTEKERLLRALTLINDIEDCIVDNKWKKYLQDHLIVVEYELQRQLSLINADDRRRIQIGNPEYSDDAEQQRPELPDITETNRSVSYTHLRAHETR